MLQMRPNCECCNKNLPAESLNARICSFECTYCADCADTVLAGRCPNCAGVLSPRPSRELDLLGKYPASATRVFKPEKCQPRAD